MIYFYNNSVLFHFVNANVRSKERPPISPHNTAEYQHICNIQILLQGISAAIPLLVDLISITTAQHANLAAGGPHAAGLKPQDSPFTLGFPLYSP
jgi:hypothetical protein